MNRRDFLTRGTLALAGGLLVGDAALEAFDRLTHRKVWALGEVYQPSIFTERDLQEAIKRPYINMTTDFYYINMTTDFYYHHGRLFAIPKGFST